MVRLEVEKITVEIDGGEVTAQPSEIAELLANHLEFYPSPGPADPDPDMLQAERLIADFGGQILSADPPPEYEPGIVY